MSTRSVVQLAKAARPAVKGGITAADINRIAGAINTGLRGAGEVIGAGAKVVSAPVRYPVGLAGKAGRAAYRGLGLHNTNKMKAMVMGAGVVGLGAGIASGVRSTAQDANRTLGNPMGFVSGMGVRTAFSGNPNGTRTQRGGASGAQVINSRR